jgi:hypothetical protein
MALPAFLSVNLWLPLEVAMERFIHEQNLLNYRRLIAASAIDPSRNETQHAWLLKLLAEEMANAIKPLHELY